MKEELGQEEIDRLAAWLIQAPHRATLGDLNKSGMVIRFLYKKVMEQASRLESLEQEMQEQARIIGMGAERELALVAKVESLEKDAEFLNWCADRFVHVYGESECVDFVLKLRSIAAMQANKGE